MNIRELASQRARGSKKATAFFIRWFGLGTYLFFLFYFFISVALMSLTAYQMLHKISSIEVNGQSVSVANIRNYKADMDALDRWLDDARKTYDRALAARTKKSNQIDELTQKIDKEFNGHVLNELEQKERDQQSKKLARMITNFNKIEHCELIAAQNFLNSTTKQNIEFRNSSIIKYGFAKDHPISLNHDASVKKIASEPQNPDWCTYIDIGEPGTYIAVNDQINIILGELKYFGNLQDTNKPDKSSVIEIFSSWKMYDYSDIPIEMLTLILVLSMGSLGATIRLARSYVKPESNENYAHYLMFPLLGGITAFAVYVLAKAGVLIISDSSSAGVGGNSLSPYFISFIGLVSGMLVDNALNTIQGVGKGWFKDSSSEKERWAVDLKEICESKGISIIDIANLIECSPDTVQKWFDEINPVPPYPQKLIAARLNLPVRKLFSDIPPKTILTEPPVLEASIAEPT